MNQSDTRVSSLAAELAKAADLTPDQAARALAALKVADLIDNIDTVRDAMGDARLAKAFGRPPDKAKQVAAALEADRLSLRDVGLVLRGPDLLGLEIMV